MAEDRIRAGSVDERLVRLVSEPIRMKAMVMLTERSADLGEIAAEMEVSTAEAARHLEEMREEGLVELVGETSRGGSVGLLYKAAVKMLWTDEDYERLGATGRRQLSTWLVGTIESSVEEALEQGYFDRRSDSHVSRTICVVDEQGWVELNRIFDDALDAVLAVRDISAERLAESGEVGLPTLAAMICCELPPRPRQRRAS